MLAGARKNKTIDARLGKNGPGRKVAFGRKPSQVNRQQSTVLRIGMPAKIVQERKAAFGGQSGCAGQTKTIEKERCGEGRYAHERKKRQNPVRLELKLKQASL